MTANPAASGTRTPARVITCVAACTPTAIATANGRNARPVSSAPVPSTCCRYSEASRKEPNSTAEAASIITKPPPIAAIGEPLDAQERLPGAQLQRGEHGEAGDRRGADAERLRRGPAGVSACERA